MQVRASARSVRISPYKVRQVLPLIRGKNVSAAAVTLRHTPKKAARILEKVLKSAVANAANNFGLDVDALKVVIATADHGPRMKRFRPAAKGQAHAYQHRTCHITVTVAD